MSGQLNGNQKGASRRGKPNLSCPRNGKWMEPSVLQGPYSNPLAQSRWEGCGA